MFSIPISQSKWFQLILQGLVNLGIIFNDALSTKTIMDFIIPQTMDGWNIEALKNTLEISHGEKKVLISKIKGSGEKLSP